MTLPVSIIHYDDVSSIEEFKRYANDLRCPVILRKFDVGAASQKWSVDYLAKAIGSKDVKVHVSQCNKLDFLRKNFLYRTLPFDVFIKRASQEHNEDFFLASDEIYYLRSLGEDPRKDVADIRTQFPILKEDLSVPELYEPDQFFSSVFRISSKGTQLWTHYDVMDNMLVHLRGRKRVVFFPPSDALKMYLSGDKSRVIDIDNPDAQTYPDFISATKYECFLNEGDILFIPALWFHNVTALDFAVSVNVFWRHLHKSLYSQKDLYGNQDLLPACRAMQGLEKAVKALSELPEEYRNFYRKRLIGKLLDK